MQPSVRSLIAARSRTREGLQALAVALAARVVDTPDLPTDPAEVWAVAETQDVAPGTWQEVRAARDDGELSETEYDYLSAAVEALTMEETDV